MKGNTNINKTLMSREDPSIKGSVISQFQHSLYSSLCRASIQQLFVYECTCVFVLVIGIIVSSHGNSSHGDNFIFSSQVFIVIIVVAIAMSGTLSGSNLNPSVSLSNCLKKENRYQWSMLGIYLGAQLAGSLLGIAVADFLINGDLAISSVTNLKEVTAVVIVKVLISQITATFILVFFLLQISNPNTTFIQNEISAYLSISIIVQMSRVFAFKSGFNANPSIVLSICLYKMAIGELKTSGIAWAPIWIIGDVLGTVLAVKFYDSLFEPTINRIRQNRRFIDQEDWDLQQDFDLTDN